MRVTAALSWSGLALAGHLQHAELSLGTCDLDRVSCCHSFLDAGEEGRSARAAPRQRLAGLVSARSVHRDSGLHSAFLHTSLPPPLPTSGLSRRHLQMALGRPLLTSALSRL